ncbi:hypothetical protein [Actinokineospora sp.]|uniref:hypothetical protein n=1 Tax=Actinokineospora sp. TaxID=1872133 RepID=UPI003D6A5EB7
MFGPGLFLRILTAAGLAVSSYIHFDLAAADDANVADISQGTLFRASRRRSPPSPRSSSSSPPTGR